MADNRVRLLASLDDKVSRPLDKIRDKFNLLGKNKGAAAVLQGLGVGVGLNAYGLLQGAIGGVSNAAFKAIESASNLNESQSKAKVVFGQSSDAIASFARSAASNLGLSEQAALEASAQFGNLFVGLKLGEPAAAAMSKQMVTLAGDLASFNNLDPTVALEKLRSGLAGEAEPLRSLGVFLTEAKVKAEAMALGLAKGNKPLTEAAKIQARYSLILKETTTAQGDFSRTSKGLANTQRILAAEMENLSAEAGKVLLPAALELARAFQRDVLPAIKGVFRELEQGQNDKLFGNLANLLDDLSKRGEKSKTFFGTLEEGFQGFTDNLNEFAGNLNDAWTFWDTFTTEAEDRARAAAGSVEAITNAMTHRTAEMLDYGRGAVATAAEGLAGEVPEKLEIAKARAIKVAQKTPGEIAAGLLSRRDAWTSALDNLNTATETKLSRMAEIAKLKALLSGDQIAAGLRSKDPVVRAAAAALKETAEARLNELRGAASRAGQLAGRDLAEALKDKKLTVKQAADLLELQVKNALGQLPSSAYGWGASTGREYAEGLRSKAEQVRRAAAYLAAAAAANLEIHSPAKEGPLSKGGPEVWGAKFGTEWAAGLASKVGNVGAAATTYAGAVAMPGNARGLSVAAAAYSYVPVQIPVMLDGREVARVIEPHLYYRLAAQR